MNNSLSPDFANPGIPGSNLGLILQRGGQELILEKALDCFTVRPATNVTSQQLSQISWAFGAGVFLKRS